MPVTKQTLSAPRQRFLELMQTLNYGQIRDLVVQDGEPQFKDETEVVKDWKLDGDNNSRPELHLRDFALKEQHYKLFEVFDAVSNGIIDEIHVRNGLPCRVITSRSAA